MSPSSIYPYLAAGIISTSTLPAGASSALCTAESVAISVSKTLKENVPPGITLESTYNECYIGWDFRDKDELLLGCRAYGKRVGFIVKIPTPRDCTAVNLQGKVLRYSLSNLHLEPTK